MFVCVTSNQSTNKKTNVLHLSKLALLHKTHIKVLRLDMCTFMISLSKIAHQMWRDHPFSQRNKTTQWAVRNGIGGNREEGWGEGGEGWTKFEKEGGRQYRGVFIKQGVRTPLPPMRRDHIYQHWRAVLNTRSKCSLK